jgi:hypothetical protein
VAAATEDWHLRVMRSMIASWLWCRKCEDVGRSVTARGLWCDILCSPYHAFGTASENQSLLAVSNRQFKHTAVDVSRLNLLALLAELRGASSTEELPAHKPARGPTSIEVCHPPSTGACIT